jgi:hypothetical protein
MNKGFRPRLPSTLYPALRDLINDCWLADATARPTFDQIVARLEGPISHEVDTLPEPIINDSVDESLFTDEGEWERRLSQNMQSIAHMKSVLEDLEKKKLEMEQEVVGARERRASQTGSQVVKAAKANLASHDHKD